MRTLFNQEMIRRGILMPYLSPSLAHDEHAVETTVAAARESFTVLARAIEQGCERLLEGPTVKPVFRAFN